MAAFWAVFTYGGSGPALTTHDSLELNQEISKSNANSNITSKCTNLNEKGGCLPWRTEFHEIS
jgi:hypothetical protein